MAGEKGYRQLEVFRRSYELALRVHRATARFPDFERVEVGRQLREATKSISANIAEGYGRRGSRADQRRFLIMALGSCEEVQVWLSFARDLGYLDGAGYEALHQGYQEMGRMLNGLLKAWTPEP